MSICPQKKFRIGKISSAVFERPSKNDATVVRKSISIQKSSRDPGTGEWKNETVFLFPGEVHALLTVAQKAYDYCSVEEKGSEEAQ